MKHRNAPCRPRSERQHHGEYHSGLQETVPLGRDTVECDPVGYDTVDRNDTDTARPSGTRNSATDPRRNHPYWTQGDGNGHPHPTGHLASMTPEQLQAYRWEKEIDERNRPFSVEELDAMFPPVYKVRKLIATPMAGTPAGFFMQAEDKSAKFIDNQPKGNLPFMKPEDAQYFNKLLLCCRRGSSQPRGTEGTQNYETAAEDQKRNTADA